MIKKDCHFTSFHFWLRNCCFSCLFGLHIFGGGGKEITHFFLQHILSASLFLHFDIKTGTAGCLRSSDGYAWDSWFQFRSWHQGPEVWLWAQGGACLRFSPSALPPAYVCPHALIYLKKKNQKQNPKHWNQ